MKIENRKIRTVMVDYLENIIDNRNLKEELVKALVDKAITGDVKAFELVAKIAGEFPNKRQFTETDDEINSDNFIFNKVNKLNHQV